MDGDGGDGGWRMEVRGWGLEGRYEPQPSPIWPLGDIWKLVGKMPAMALDAVYLTWRGEHRRRPAVCRYSKSMAGAGTGGRGFMEGFNGPCFSVRLADYGLCATPRR